MQTVLITTSGIGQRLGELTKYLNKSLIRIGNKFSICYIIDKYDSTNTQFVITLGYLGYLVKEFLDIAYKNNNFIYVNIDNYDKEGSSLAYSLLQAKNVLQCPFTFYCCDSIVIDKINSENHKNVNIIYVSKCDDGTSYASVDTFGKNISKINPKGAIKYDFVYTGVSYIHDYKEYWKELEILYSEQSDCKELSDIHLINILIQKNINFEYRELFQWYDIGNIKSLNSAVKNIKCDYDVLHKNNESICFLNDKVIKGFSDTNTIINRVQRGQLLYPICPKILDYNHHFFSMEYVEGTLMSKHYVHGEIYKLLSWAHEHLWINKLISTDNIDKCLQFYKIKTLERINSLEIKELNNVNGLEILPIKQLLEIIDWKCLSTDEFYHFHGDFILDNIFATNGTYKVIDWRQDFAGNITHGDIYYDLAKLRHNIIFNHDNIKDGLFKLDIIDENSVIVDLKCNFFLIQQLHDFDKFITEHKFNKKKIELLTSIIWLNMAPLYEHSLSQFLFYFSKYNLALFLQDHTLP